LNPYANYVPQKDRWFYGQNFSNWMLGLPSLTPYSFGGQSQQQGTNSQMQNIAIMDLFRDPPASPFEAWRRAAMRPDPAIATPLRDKSWLMLVLPLAAGLVYSMAYFLVNS
jgi:hypothetical protein